MNPIDRALIREYFECLKKRRTTTESFAKQVISDLLAHWKENRAPKEGIWAYIIVGVLLFSLLFSPALTVFLFLTTVFIAQLRIKPNINPPVDDKQIDRWLLEDKQNILEKIPDELNVILVGNSQNTPKLLNVVLNQDAPIELSSGFILENDNNYLKNSFVSKDYYVEKGLDNKTRYSIHVFMVIYLCRNFLTYYKCYWNFISGAANIVETGEYLYDTIVSVKTEELSLLKSVNDDGEKLILKKVLRISTTDGKELEFPAISDIRVSYESLRRNDISPVRDAAHIIREMIRERRIDVQIVKPFDADD